MKGSSNNNNNSIHFQPNTKSSSSKNHPTTATATAMMSPPSQQSQPPPPSHSPPPSQRTTTTNSNGNSSNNNRPRPTTPSPPPLVPRTRLSDILPPREAVELLGEETTRMIIRQFLRCGCVGGSAGGAVGVAAGVGNSNGSIIGNHNNSTSSSINNSNSSINSTSSISSNNSRMKKTITRHQHPLDPKETMEERAEIDNLLLGLCHDFSNPFGGCDDEYENNNNNSNNNDNDNDDGDDEKHNPSLENSYNDIRNNDFSYYASNDREEAEKEEEELQHNKQQNKQQQQHQQKQQQQQKNKRTYYTEEQKKQLKLNVAYAWKRMGFHSIPGYEIGLATEVELVAIPPSRGGGEGEETGRVIVISNQLVPHPSNGNNDTTPTSYNTTTSTSSTTTTTTTTTTNNPTPTVESLYTTAVRRTSTVLGLDKTLYQKRGILFPPTTVPDRGNNGHGALMDCVFNALSTAPTEIGALMEEAVRTAREIANAAAKLVGSGIGGGIGGKRSTLLQQQANAMQNDNDRMVHVIGAGRGRARILLPDLVIAFGICRLGEWDLEYRGFLEGRRLERERERERRHRVMQDSLMELESSSLNLVVNDDDDDDVGSNGDVEGGGSNGDVGVGEGDEVAQEKNSEGEGDATDKEESKEDTTPSSSSLFEESKSREPPPPPRPDGLLLACLLSFRIYDGYQRQNSLVRDTLQRFLSDVHGEESPKAPAVRACLDKIFTQPQMIPEKRGADWSGPVDGKKKVPRHPTPPGNGGTAGARILTSIDPEAFQRGVHSTMVFLQSSVTNTALQYDGSKHQSLSGMDSEPSSSTLVASHILLDWIMILFNCMLPRVLPPPPKVAEHHLRIVNADPVRMIDALSTKYGLYDGDGQGDNVLYEIRRRFHSLQQYNLASGTATLDTTTKEKGELNPEEGSSDHAPTNTTSGLPLEESPSSSVGAANVCPNTGALLVPSTEGDDLESTPRPRNVVDEHSFVVAVSKQNDELGHGGYLPAELARWTFRACAGRAEEIKAAHGHDLWHRSGVEKGGSKEKRRLPLKQSSSGECFWTMYDALSFGCDAVRWDALANSSDSTDDDVQELQLGNGGKFASDMPLLRLAFKTFQQLPRQEQLATDLSEDDDDTKEVTEIEFDESVLTRSQIGKMLLLLLEHYSFRLEADSPPVESTPESRNPWSKPSGTSEDRDEEGVELIDDDNYLRNLRKATDGTDYILTTLVDANYASLLGLKPPKLDLTKFSNPSKSTQSDEETSSASMVPLSVLVDYVIAESCGNSQDSQISVLDFKGFVQWHLHLSSNETDDAIPISENRLGPYIMDLRLIASVLFGLRPASPSMEHILIDEIQRRHKYRYPRTRDGSSKPRGPVGTVWYLINANWLRTWKHFSKGIEGTNAAGGNLSLGKIDNNMLLSEEGILSIKQNLHWKQDFELLEPLAWSALQAWHDGGPPITRMVVPFRPGKSDTHNRMAYSPSRKSAMNVAEEHEIELYPLFVTVFLCDTASKGEPRPFQQYVPLSRYLPLEELVDKLCEGLGRDATKPPHCRLWMMDSTGASMSRAASSPCKADDSLGWILDLDLTISNESNIRGMQLSKDENNISLMLEVRNEKDGTWPRSKSKMAKETGKDFQEGSEENEPVLGDGIMGLHNMGNTCYLNSSIQCLSHTPILKNYFTSKAYLHDINTTNPLGHQGRLAQAFAVLVNNLWKKNDDRNGPSKKINSSTASCTPINAPSLTPKSFREAIGKFNEHFAGNEQHDAQELLAFLLSGLSEDLNRIMKKPYIEAPDSDGRPDEELADIWWANHLKRELSIIEALFTGQYKSSLTCKTCKYESARFEPFAYLQLPLPEDDQISIQCILYPMEEKKDIMKYSVRVRHDGSVNDVLISLANILHMDKEEETQLNDDCKNTVLEKSEEGILPDRGTDDGNDSSDENNDASQETSLFAEIAQSMAVVDMGESCIRKIIPHSWALSKLAMRDSGEIPPLHVYEIESVVIADPANSSNDKNITDTDIDNEDNAATNKSSSDSTTGDNGAQTKLVSPVKYSYLAISQRKLDFVPGPFLHPFQLAVFGSPLLLRVRDLEGYTGNDLYAHISKRIRRFVPDAPPYHEESSTSTFSDKVQCTDAFYKESSAPTTRQARRDRQHRQKTTPDMESVSAGEIPPYGFRLRFVSRDGSRCALCPWFACCIGCVIPCDDFPAIAMCGDSVAIDWHLSVNIRDGGFGWKINSAETVGTQASPHEKALTKMKKHSSFNTRGNRYGYSGSITLEECLDSFAKEEKIPEAYCSNCKEFRVQTKRMSLWRFPPLVIIHLKRFQFTQHMKRKLRDLVVFPIEGLDLSRIVAPSSSVQESKSNGNPSPKATPDKGPDGDSTVNSEEFLGGSFHPLSRNNCGRTESIYDLYGVVHHQGALSGGHYVASLKSEFDGKWHLFNDDKIYEMLSREVVDPSAYILFYMRRDVKGATLEDFWDTQEREGEGLTEEEVEKMMKQRDRCVIS